MTIIDIARVAGVSVTTVSRVLNNHPDVSQKTRDKVMAAINENQYIPNDSARNLKRESLRAVAVIVKGFSNPIFTAMLEIIHQELENNDYLMLLHQVDPSQDEVAAAISFCKEKKPQGLIFMGGNFQHSRGMLSMLNVPYVMLTITMHKNVDRSTFSSVTVDDYAAGYTVAKQAIKAGHRELAVIGSNANDRSISRLRIDGFRMALSDLHCDFEENHIAYAGQFSYQAGYDAAKHLLSRVSFTCLFCISDILAIGAVRAIHDAGLTVPDNISVVGFDGIDEGRYHIPSLATMRQPQKEMALSGVQILLSHIRKRAPHKHLLFEPSFFMGESFAVVTPSR